MVSAELTPLFFFGVLFSEAEPDAEADAEAEPWSWSSSMDGMSSMVMGEFVSTQSSVARALPTMLYCIRSSVMSGCKASV